MMTIHSGKKKILSLLLALLMLTSTAAPVFADLIAFVTTEDQEKAPVYTDGLLEAWLGEYAVRVTYGADAQIPEGAELQLYEYVEGTLQYDEYRAAAEAQVLGEEEQTVFARFIDITINYTDPATGETKKIEPAAPVSVEIESPQLVDAEKVSVVHFPGEETAEGIVESAIKAAFGDRGVLVADMPAEGIGRDDLLTTQDMPEDMPAADAEPEVPVDIENSAVEVIPAETVAAGVVMFSADGFSVYGILACK